MFYNGELKFYVALSESDLTWFHCSRNGLLYVWKTLTAVMQIHTDECDLFQQKIQNVWNWKCS